MTTYRATFSNGKTKEIQNSRKQYTHAWRIEWNNEDNRYSRNYMIGFAGSRELAEKAARSSHPSCWNEHKRKWIKDISRVVAIEIVSVVVI